MQPFYNFSECQFHQIFCNSIVVDNFSGSFNNCALYDVIFYETREYPFASLMGCTAGPQGSQEIPQCGPWGWVDDPKGIWVTP